MSEQKSSIWIVLISLLMLFVSGAWTVASIMLFARDKVLGLMMLVTATVSNISFLLTLLAAVLLYVVESRKKLRKIMVCLFSAGIIALATTMMLFLIVYLTRPPPFLD